MDSVHFVIFYFWFTATHTVTYMLHAVSITDVCTAYGMGGHWLYIRMKLAPTLLLGPTVFRQMVYTLPFQRSTIIYVDCNSPVYD